jgi:tetratricopeptide (TPR) repeat protein
MRSNLLVRSWTWVWGLAAGLTVWLLDALIFILQSLFSREGLVWIGVTFVLGSAFFGWIQTPLQNVNRAYALPLLSEPGPNDALTNPFHLLSYGVVCLLAVFLVIGGAVLRWPLGLRRHVGAALLLVVLAFPVALVCRHSIVLERLDEQSGERANILSFALAVGGYAAGLPPLVLSGTTTLLDRVYTAHQVVGYGCWIALWGSILVLAAVALPAAMAEYQRLRGEALYARARYAEAIDHFEAALRWSPALRENPTLQDRIGATLYWMGDRTSPQTRFFVSDNLQAQGQFPRAEMELTQAMAADPGWRLPRRKLAELNAAWGVRLFRGVESGAIPRWERALKLDEDMRNVRYYLTHSYYLLDDRDQTRALSYGLQLVELAPERGLLADVYQRLGDIYFKERRDADARAMYRLSLVMIPLVKQLNLQAQRGLIGL